MKGYLILCGGEAFSPKPRQMHYNWLQLIRRQSRPRLAIVPVAAMDNAIKEAQQVADYFKNLATFPEYTQIVNQLSANTRTEYEMLDKVDAIILTDGSPIDTVERLEGTHTEATLHRALLRKAALFATGASAMALGGVYWLGGEWLPGLSVAPHLAILPHHEYTAMRLPPERLLAGLPAEVTLLGIDEATAVICLPDGAYQVEGEGVVTVYRSVEQQDEYEAGQRFQLAPAAEE